VTDTPTTFAETVREILESFSGDLHVAIPGVVESYDEGSLTADIRPGLRRYVPARDDEAEDKTEPLPVLPGVPVVWPFGGGLFVHGGLTAGDSVLLVICSTDPGAWRASDGSQVDPSHPLRHGLGGAVAIPGLLRRGAEFTPDGASIGLDGNSAQILFRTNQIRAGGTEPMARADALDAHLAQIAASIQALAAGITGLGGSAVVTYSSAQKTALDVSNPIPTAILRGD
jgi:hypothetical protein